MSSNSWLRTHDHMTSNRATGIVGAARMPTDLNLDPLPIEFQGESFHERNKMFLSKMLLRTLMFCVASGLPISVYAQSSLFGSSVYADISVGLWDGTTPGGASLQDDVTDVDGGSALIDMHMEEVIHGGAAGFGLAEASASPGQLKLRILGEATATGYSQDATTSIRATASFFDTVTFSRSRPDADEIPIGTVMIAKATIDLHGWFKVDGKGVLSRHYDLPAADYQQGSGSVTLRINGIPNSPYPFGVFGHQEHGYISRFPKTVQDVTFIDQPAPDRIDIERAWLWGSPNHIELAMTLDGLAFAADNLAGGGSQALGEFEAAFARTLTWGGISSIVRYDTMETITDWTISSASGFDYSKPAGVPEPSGLLLAATAALLLVRRRHKRS